MLYKIRCNPMHPLYGALPFHMCQCGLHAVLWSHIGMLMRFLAAESRRTFIPVQCTCGTMFLTVFDGAGLSGFKSRPNAFLLALSCSIPTIVFYFSLSLLPKDWYCGAEVFGLIRCISLSLSLPLPTSFNNNNNNNNNIP